MSEEIYEEDEPETTEEVAEDAVIENEEITKADARERAARTFKQGLWVTLGLAILGAVLQVISTWTGADLMTPASWSVLAVAVLQAAATAGMSYIKRFTSTPENTLTE